MKQSVFAIALILSLSVLGASAGKAEPIPLTGKSEADWRYSLALYAFLPARTDGTSTVAGSTVPLDLNLREAIDLLDFAASGRFEAWRGNLGVIVDANYVALNADGALPAPPGATFSADIRQKWLGILVAYKVIDGTYGKNNRRFAIDLQAGARYNSLRQEITVTTPGPVVLPLLGGDESWWEPVIGARGTWVLNDKWAAMASIDLGGFGAGGNDLQVGLNAGVDWQVWTNTSLFFGYRYYSMDYSTVLPTGAFAYDVEQHGPVFGVKFRF